MSRMNDAMIDFCELSNLKSNGDYGTHVDLETTMNRLMGVDGLEALRVEQAYFRQFWHTKLIVDRIKAATDERRLRWATKLWNVVDSMERPEALWNLMLRELPDCFYEPSANCLKFTY